MNFFQRWGYPANIPLTSKTENTNSSSIKNTHRYVDHFMLTVYSNRQMQYELDNSTRYFPNIKALTLRFEHPVSCSLFRAYIEKTINLSSIKKLVLSDKCHSVATFYELVSCKYIHNNCMK